MAATGSARKGSDRRRRSNILATAVLTVWVIFVLFPLYWIATMSLKRDLDLFVRPPKLFNFTPTLDNYALVLNLARFEQTTKGAATSDFPAYFAHSLIIVTCAIAITLLFGTLAAYAMARYRFVGRENLAVLVLVVRMIPVMSIIMPLYLLFRNWGLYNSYQGLILVYQLIGLPYFIWLMRGHVASVPREIDDAARVDGCSVAQILLHVVVPLIAPGLAASGILAFIYMWNNFTFALLLGGPSVQPVTVGILNYMGYEQVQYARMAAASIICITPEIAVGMFIQRYIVKGLAAGSVKG